MIKEEIQFLRKQLTRNNHSVVFESLEKIFSLAQSEFLTDLVLINAQFNKLQIDQRRGLIDYQQIRLMQNGINAGLLSLIEEVEKNSGDFNSYALVSSTITRMSSEIDPDLKLIITGNLLRRMAYAKRRNIELMSLWIDDKPQSIFHERQLLGTIGVQIRSTDNSEEAYHLLKSSKYDIIISNINRSGNAEEGLNFHKKLIRENLFFPIIYYIGTYRKELGVPGYAFGITNSPFELIHLVIDFMERN